MGCSESKEATTKPAQKPPPKRTKSNLGEEAQARDAEKQPSNLAQARAEALERKNLHAERDTRRASTCGANSAPPSPLPAAATRTPPQAAIAAPAKTSPAVTPLEEALRPAISVANANSHAGKQMIALLNFVRGQTMSRKNTRKFTRWAPYQTRFAQYIFVDALRALDYGDELRANMSDSEDEDSDDELNLTQISVDIEEGYAPPEGWLDIVIDDLKNNKKMPTPEIFSYLITAATDDILLQDTCNHIQIPDDCRLVVVGDLHGQLDDLLWILKEGLPGPNLWYLFNGDFVDRGPDQLEVLTLLVALKNKFPGSVFMNRGNHEEHRINKAAGRDGYASVCLRKLGQKCYLQSQTFFKSLPLCHVINGKIAVVHGGLPDDRHVTLKEITAIDRFRECPSSTNKAKNPPATREDRIFQALLWSDPKEMEARARPSPRGAGCLFNGDVTEEFLDGNGLTLLLRSHELVTGGNYLVHSDKCMTVFSASRYCGKDDNLGSYLVLLPDLEMSVHWYSVRAGQVSSLRTKIGLGGKVDEEELLAYTNHYNSAELEALKEAVLARISGLVSGNRPLLLQMFQKQDPKQSGTVTKRGWVRVMRQLFGDLPWYSLSRHLLCCEADGTVPYVTFLNRYQVRLEWQWRETWAKKVMKYGGYLTLHCAGSLREDLDAFSKTGKLTYHQIGTAIRKSMPSLGVEEVYAIVSLMDDSGDGFIDLAEWDTHVQRAHRPDALPGVLALWDLRHSQSKAFYRLYDRLKEAADADGRVANATFIDLCKGAPGMHDVGTWETTARTLSAGTDGFAVGLLRERLDSLEQDFRRVKVITGIVESLTSAKVRLMQVFSALDADDSGGLSCEEFVMGLQELGIVDSEDDAGEEFNSAGRHSTISLDDARTLFAVADVDGDGHVSLMEFMATLAPTDTWATSTEAHVQDMYMAVRVPATDGVSLAPMGTPVAQILTPPMKVSSEPCLLKKTVSRRIKQSVSMHRDPTEDA